MEMIFLSSTYGELTAALLAGAPNDPQIEQHNLLFK